MSAPISAELHRRQLYGRRVRRGRQSVGRGLGALSLGIVNKFLEPFAGAILGKIVVLVAHHPVHPAAPARPVRAQRAGGGGMSAATAPTLDARWSCCCGGAALLAALNLGLAPSSPLHVPIYLVAAVRQISVLRDAGAEPRSDLGICRHPEPRAWRVLRARRLRMGMYLMRQIGTRGVYGNPLLPDFMVFLNWKELPWFWWGFDHFAFARRWSCWCPACSRSCSAGSLPLARHRRLSVDHHAGDDLRADARLLPQRHGVRRQ